VAAPHPAWGCANPRPRHRSEVANIKFDPGTNFHIQIGGRLRAHNMGGD
jgi:hypothetical protein